VPYQSCSDGSERVLKGCRSAQGRVIVRDLEIKGRGKRKQGTHGRKDQMGKSEPFDCHAKKRFPEFEHGWISLS
jgi:hypothetical protein